MRLSHLIVPALAIPALAACNSEVPQGSQPEATVAQTEQPPVAASATPVADETKATDTTGEAVPNPYASGKPGQPAIPVTVEDPDWQRRYSPDVPYYNRSASPIPATMGASPRTALVGQVMPNDGGFIQTCERNSTYCKITFGGEGKAGYVNMDLMSGEAR